MEKRKELWRALPFVMALLLLTLVPVQSASAIFGRGKEETKAVEGAPVAENMAIRVFRGVAYEGAFRAVDNEGDTLFIEKLPVEAGDAVTFDQVLAIVDGENTKFGTPVVEGAKVEATVVKNGKGKKVRVYKYKAKKGYHKRQGHRQPYTKVEIGKISV